MTGSATKQSSLPSWFLDCFAEPVIGRRFAPTRWLAMTNKGCPLSVLLADDRVEAVRAAACGCEVKTGKAEQNGSRTAVNERQENRRGWCLEHVPEEISESHL